MVPRSSTCSTAYKLPAANHCPLPTGLQLPAPARRQSKEVLSPGADCSMRATWPEGLEPPSNDGALRPGGRGLATLAPQAHRFFFGSVVGIGPPGVPHTQARWSDLTVPSAHVTSRPQPPITCTRPAVDPHGLSPPPPPATSKVGPRECRVPGHRSSIAPSPAGCRRPLSPH
ncbi:hypothetical protein NDU88_007661 [Pleurodeles waltl]|uniref:Uncharacterized protein n=1 Tax=Pleurodeles waltl TaxID=8319 RepID=A0AAV7NU89_PLEWA|nr:hypothetical protein NDU88_007661 [Pleurodeles waltl]